MDSSREGESACKRKKRYVDSLTGKPKICLIHSPGHSSEECKVLGDIVTKYAKNRTTKDHGSRHVSRGEIKRQQENSSIINNAVDEIILSQKVSAKNHEAPEFLNSDYDTNDLYEVDKMSLE